jgi:hypothetical protein
MEKTENRGGARTGAGRKPKEIKLKSRTIRLTDDQWKKFIFFGGVKWLREILK